MQSSIHQTALCAHGRGGAEEEELLDRFRRAGFTQVRDYPHLSIVYCSKDKITDELVEALPSRRDSVAV